MSYADRQVAERRRLWERDSGTCQLCGLPVAFESMHLDHIIPKSKGGSWDEDNLRTAHRFCNISRGNRENWTPGAKSHRVVFSLILEPDLLQQVDDFRFANRFPSRAETIKGILRKYLAP